MNDNPVNIWISSETDLYAWHPESLAIETDIKYTRAGGWEPIETAPKYHSLWLWLWVTGHGLVTCRWTDTYGGDWLSLQGKIIKSAKYWRKIESPDELL